MITCKLLSPTRYTVYEGIASASLPGFYGEFQILPQHAETFQLLGEGSVILRRGNGVEEKTDISRGACYFVRDVLTIIL